MVWYMWKRKGNPLCLIAKRLDLARKQKIEYKIHWSQIFLTTKKRDTKLPHKNNQINPSWFYTYSCTISYFISIFSLWLTCHVIWYNIRCIYCGIDCKQLIFHISMNIPPIFHQLHQWPLPNVFTLPNAAHKLRSCLK